MPEGDQSSGGKTLTQEQRIGVVLLSIFAILAVGLGFLQIRNSMYAPFALNNDVTSAVADKMDTVSALHYRDTDKDGLNDFDELYVYNTSRYLADSDSDGLTDKQELDAGQDPLCAQGKECENSGQAGIPMAEVFVSTTTPNPEELLLVLQDPKKIREMLESYGMEKEMLNKIPDQELMTLVEEILASTNTPR